MTARKRKGLERRLVRKGKVIVPQAVLEQIKRKVGGSSGRSFNIIVRNFHLNPEELIGKTVLDVGTGESNFVAECNKRGIKAKGIDLQITGKNIRKGFAQKMPFPDQTFDLVISNYTEPWHEKTRLATRLAIYEMLRVTTENGKIMLSPVLTAQRARQTKLHGSGPYFFTPWAIKRLREAGFKVHTSPFKPKPDSDIVSAPDLTLSIFKHRRTIIITRTKKADLEKLRKSFFGA